VAEPGDPDLWTKLAALQHRRLGQTRAALQSLKQALVIAAGHPGAAALLAEIERGAMPRPI
jgi:hypothetical protein